MLTLLQANNLSAFLVKKYRDMENRLLVNMADPFNTGDFDFDDPNFDVEAWYNYMLSKWGKVIAGNKSIVNEETGGIHKMVASIMVSVAFLTALSDDKVYQEALSRGLLQNAPVAAAESTMINRLVSMYIYETNRRMDSITANSLHYANSGYMDAVNRAYTEVAAGNTTIREATQRAVREMADQGITGVQYRTRRDHSDVAAQRAIRTATRQEAGQISLQRASEWGATLVEVSSHLGARPTHAAWQGQIYSITGRTELYADFYQSTGYGEITGLCGINCGHDFYPYFDGLSSRTFYPYDEKENERVYALTEDQRYMERTIREYERREIAARAAGQTQNAERAAAKNAEWRGALTAFEKANDLTHRSANLYVDPRTAA